MAKKKTLKDLKFPNLPAPNIGPRPRSVSAPTIKKIEEGVKQTTRKN
jgi:hypothetical protein